ncbi:hypothetical protein Leryth_002545 [Lithospermum erythrorhizon]|nr:hypothetical protein Leryth_002545 [Lithospermum erythrorhizon]
MDRLVDKKFPSTSEDKFPNPPPYPCFRRRDGGLKSGSSCRGRSYALEQDTWDRLFDDGYRADVVINTDHGGIIYAHANVLGMASPVLRGILQSRSRRSIRRRSISISGVPPEAVHVFIRFLYSACYDEQKLDEYALQLLMLSHAYVVPHLKRLCEQRIEQRLITSEDTTDIFQLALLCDAPRLSLICHRFILNNFKAVSATDGWKAMKNSHPILEQTITESIIEENAMSIFFFLSSIMTSYTESVLLAIKPIILFKLNLLIIGVAYHPKINLAAPRRQHARDSKCFFAILQDAKRESLVAVYIAGECGNCLNCILAFVQTPIFVRSRCAGTSSRREKT